MATIAAERTYHNALSSGSIPAPPSAIRSHSHQLLASVYRFAKYISLMNISRLPKAVGSEAQLRRIFHAYFKLRVVESSDVLQYIVFIHYIVRKPFSLQYSQPDILGTYTSHNRLQLK